VAAKRLYPTLRDALPIVVDTKRGKYLRAVEEKKMKILTRLRH